MCDAQMIGIGCVIAVILVIFAMILYNRSRAYKIWNNGRCAECNTVWEHAGGYVDYTDYACQCDKQHRFSTQFSLPDLLPRDEKIVLLKTIAGLQTTVFRNHPSQLKLLHWIRSNASLGLLTPNNQTCNLVFDDHARFVLSKHVDGYLYGMLLPSMKYESNDSNDSNEPQDIILTIEGPDVYYREYQTAMVALALWGTPTTELHARIEQLQTEKDA